MHAFEQFDLSRWSPGADETPFAYWASLSPMAPFFGVQWRFAPEAKQTAVFKPTLVVNEEPVPVPTTPEPTVETPPVAAAKPDDLTKIKGIGPKLCEKLNEAGVTTFAQIAAWTERDVDSFEAMFGELPGRIERDNWIGQAQSFASA